MNNLSILFRIPKWILTDYEQHYILFYSPILGRLTIPYAGHIEENQNGPQ